MTVPMNNPSSLRTPCSDRQAPDHPPSLRFWLMGLLVALASTMALSAWAQPHQGGAMQGGMWNSHPEQMERLLGRIHATDDQKARIQQIMQKARSRSEERRVGKECW